MTDACQDHEVLFRSYSHALVRLDTAHLRVLKLGLSAEKTDYEAAWSELRQAQTLVLKAKAALQKHVAEHRCRRSEKPVTKTIPTLNQSTLIH